MARLIFATIAYVYTVLLLQKKNFRNKYKYKKYFLLAFYFKFSCTILHSLIIQFYYNKVSDSFTYYNEILNIKSQLSNNSNASLWDFYFDRDTFSKYTGLDFGALGSNVTANVPLIALPLSYVFFDSYLCISFFLGFLSLFSCYKMYLVFSNIYPDCKVEAIIATVLLPGLTFWSSILLKDTLSLIGVGYALWYFWKIAILKKFNILNLVGLGISLAFIYYFKPYILVIILSFLMWYGLTIYKSIKNSILRWFTLFSFFVVIFFSIYYSLNKLNELESGPLAAYNTENIVQQVEGFQVLYESETSESSYFSLGDIDFNNPLSVIGAAPRALSSVFFQPFIWEARKPIMLLSSLESLLILYLFLFAVFNTKVIGFLWIILKDPFLSSFFLFCLFFGTVVAISTPNFGTLARYKIPCMPFMVFILMVVRRKIKITKKDKNLSENLNAN